METPTFNHAAKVAYELGWNPDFAAFRQALLDHGLRDEVEEDRAHVREAEARRSELEHCETPQATAACKVEVRYIYQILRGYPPQQVFAQTLLGFETIAAVMTVTRRFRNSYYKGRGVLRNAWSCYSSFPLREGIFFSRSRSRSRHGRSQQNRRCAGFRSPRAV
jgi:hypothetical protein